MSRVRRASRRAWCPTTVSRSSTAWRGSAGRSRPTRRIARCACSGPTCTQAFDSVDLKARIRVPTNAHSFSYRFNFFSSEYPEWVCTAYNDGFVALLKTGYLPANPAANSGNISFDSANNPVSVNIGFFTITSGPKLTGTGMDGICDGKICGGSTDWLQTTAPVVPGETINLGGCP